VAAKSGQLMFSMFADVFTDEAHLIVSSLDRRLTVCVHTPHFR